MTVTACFDALLSNPPFHPRCGNAGAIAAVSARSEDMDWHARRAAVDTLSTIAEKGDAGVIASVSARLKDADSDVRRAAMEALPKIATSSEPEGKNTGLIIGLLIMSVLLAYSLGYVQFYVAKMTLGSLGAPDPGLWSFTLLFVVPYYIRSPLVRVCYVIALPFWYVSLKF